MKTALASVVALLAAALLGTHFRHWWIGDPRLASQRTIGLAIIALMASTMVAAARPSPYPPVTPFEGDRYSASAQMGVDVARAVKAKTGARKRPPIARTRRQAVPVPAPRRVTSEAYRVEAPLSLGEGMQREVARVIGRPAAWCGWWLGRHLGMLDRRLWLARNWATVGSRAAGPAPGIIVVWRHHVGKITAVEGNRIRVLSGNDGRAVRDRWRSTAGVIAYRAPS